MAMTAGEIKALLKAETSAETLAVILKSCARERRGEMLEDLKIVRGRAYKRQKRWMDRAIARAFFNRRKRLWLWLRGVLKDRRSIQQ